MLILISYHLFILMFIYIKRSVIKNSIYTTPVIIWPCHILYSENHHHAVIEALLAKGQYDLVTAGFLTFYFSIQCLKEHFKIFFHYLLECHNAVFSLT